MNIPCLSSRQVSVCIDPIHLTVFTVHARFQGLPYIKPPLCDKLNVFPSTVMLMATTRTF